MKLVKGIWDLKQTDRTKRHYVLKGSGLCHENNADLVISVEQNQIEVCVEVITESLFLYSYEEDTK